MLPWFPVLALLLNACVWGVSWWPFKQLEAQGLHPLWTTAGVYTASLLGVWLWRPRAWRDWAGQPALWGLLLAAGLTNVGFNWAVTVGDVVRVVLLFYLMPAWSVLLAWPLLGERPTRASLLRLALALAGVALVLKAPNSPWPLPEGLLDALALLGGLCFALTNILLRRLSHTTEAARMLAMFGGGALQAGLGALAGLGLGLVAAPPALLGGTGWALAGLLSLGFLASNLALQYGAARLPAGTTALVMLSEIVFASASAVALGAAELQARTLLGAALILLAAALASRDNGLTPTCQEPP